MPQFDLLVTGFSVQAFYSEECISRLFLPFLQHLTSLQKKSGRRIIVCLAAPPGCGKSTLSAFLEHLSQTTPDLTPLQAVGMDGFHFPQSYLNTHTFSRDGASLPMAAYKGCPETFDTQKLLSYLTRLQTQDVTFPVYDRSLHDVVEAGIHLHENIILIEGNWLLLDTPAYRPLHALMDETLFLTAPSDILRQRLIARKIRGGVSEKEAEAFYERSDRLNVLFCLSHSLPARICWRLTPQGDFTDSE